MENRLRNIFEYQHFIGSRRLESFIEKTETKYRASVGFGFHSQLINHRVNTLFP